MPFKNVKVYQQPIEMMDEGVELVTNPESINSAGGGIDASNIGQDVTQTVPTGANIAIGTVIGSATEGSVLFAGVGGILQQDNANFFWDDTNDRLDVANIALGFANGSIPYQSATGVLDDDASHLSYNPTTFDLYAWTISTTQLVITGGTEGQVIFVGPGAALYQDDDFFWNNTIKRLEIGQNNNIIIGDSAGNASMSGIKNLLIGDNAGENLTTGDENTFLGYNAGINATSGVWNVALGSLALGLGITTGDGNMAIGHSALYDVTSGANNVGIGTDAGNNITTGSSNICIGRQSGIALVGGIDNVFIGENAGFSNTGNSNVFIGHDAGKNANTNRRLYIANSDTATPLIYGEFDNRILAFDGNVGIGTITPLSELHLYKAGNPTLTIEGTRPGGSNPIGDIEFYNTDGVGRYLASSIISRWTAASSGDLEIWNTTSGSSYNTNIFEYSDTPLQTRCDGYKCQTLVRTRTTGTWLVGDYAGMNYVIGDSALSRSNQLARFQGVVTGTSPLTSQFSIGINEGGSMNNTKIVLDSDALTLDTANLLVPDGNVGIGTINSLADIHVAKAGPVSLRLEDTTLVGAADGKWDIHTLAAGGLRINPVNVNLNFEITDASGNNVLYADTTNLRTGFGETTPLGKVHITATDAEGLYIERTGVITGKYRFSIAGATDNFYFYDVDNSRTVMMFDENGRIGMGGVTAPATQVEILATTTQLRLTHTDGVDEADFTVDGDGVLSITPTSRTIYLGDGTAGDSIFGFYGNTSVYTLTHDDSEGTLDLSANDAVNFSRFETDGTLEFNGTATVWKDINMGAAQLSRPSSSQPDLETFVDENGDDTLIQTYGFAVGEKVHGSFELQHDYKEGSDFTFHVHWQGITAPSGTDNVQWKLTYTFLVDGATLDAVTTVDSADTPIDTQYKGHRTDVVVISGTNRVIGDQMVFTLERVASTGDAYAGDAVIATAGIHYEIDTVGSRLIVTK